MYTAQNGSKICTFGFWDSDDNRTAYFGTNIMRSAYVVFDVDNKQLGIGPAVANATASNITAINVGANSLIVAANSSSTATSSATGTGVVSTSAANGVGYVDAWILHVSIAATGLVMALMGGAFVL